MKKIVALLLLVVAGAAVYSPALRNGLVWDDTALVLRDPLIRSWRLIPEGFNHFLFVDATASDFYRPMQRFIYAIVYAAAAFRPFAYHLNSILWHAAAAIAFFFFAEELLAASRIELRRRRIIAFLATMVWTVHPVHSAAVAYVSGLADPMAAAFGFFGCWAVLKGVQAQGRGAAWWLAGASLLFLLSVLSKEIGFVFIATGFALLIFARSWPLLWKFGVMTLFACATYFSLRAGAGHIPPPVKHESALIVRPITVMRAFAEYAGLLVLPSNLHMDRQLDVRGPGYAVVQAAALRELQAVAGLILIASFAYWIVRSRKRNTLVFCLLILTVIAYLPVSGIWQLNASVAEHWLYVPSAFLFLAVAVTIDDLLERNTLRGVIRPALTILFVAWLTFLGVRTFRRTFDWKDQRTFLETNIANGGDSVRMWTNLGAVELSEGHLDLAKKNLQKALAKDPNEPLAVFNLAGVALKENDFKTARELLNRATQMPLVEARAYEHLVVLENKEHGEADLMRMRLAARTGSSDWAIEKRYIRLLDEAGGTPSAIAEAQHCLQTEWYRAETWELLGQLLRKSGHADEAAAAFSEARAYDVHLNVR